MADKPLTSMEASARLRAASLRFLASLVESVRLDGSRLRAGAARADEQAERLRLEAHR